MARTTWAGGPMGARRRPLLPSSSLPSSSTKSTRARLGLLPRMRRCLAAAGSSPSYPSPASGDDATLGGGVSRGKGGARPSDGIAIARAAAGTTTSATTTTTDDDVVGGVRSTGTAGASPSSPSPPPPEQRDPSSWESWQLHFASCDEDAELLEEASEALALAVDAERYADAAAAKRQVDDLAAKDAVSRVQVALSEALLEEDYEEAARLRDQGHAGLVGWWAALSPRCDPGGHLLRVSCESGRYGGLLFRASDIAELHGLDEDEGFGGMFSSSSGSPPPRSGGGRQQHLQHAFDLEVEEVGAPALEVFVREAGGGSPPPPPPALGPLISQATVLRARGLGLPSLDGEGLPVEGRSAGDDDDDGGIAEILFGPGVGGPGGFGGIERGSSSSSSTRTTRTRTTTTRTRTATTTTTTTTTTMTTMTRGSGEADGDDGTSPPSSSSGKVGGKITVSVTALDPAEAAAAAAAAAAPSSASANDDDGDNDSPLPPLVIGAGVSDGGDENVTTLRVDVSITDADSDDEDEDEGVDDDDENGVDASIAAFFSTGSSSGPVAVSSPKELAEAIAAVAAATADDDDEDEDDDDDDEASSLLIEVDGGAILSAVGDDNGGRRSIFGVGDVENVAGRGLLVAGPFDVARARADLEWHGPDRFTITAAADDDAASSLAAVMTSEAALLRSVRFGIDDDDDDDDEEDGDNDDDQDIITSSWSTTKDKRPPPPSPTAEGKRGDGGNGSTTTTSRVITVSGAAAAAAAVGGAAADALRAAAADVARAVMRAAGKAERHKEEEEAEGAFGAEVDDGRDRSSPSSASSPPAQTTFPLSEEELAEYVRNSVAEALSGASSSSTSLPPRAEGEGGDGGGTLPSAAEALGRAAAAATAASPGLRGKVTYARLPTGPPPLDPFSGLYMGCFGPDGPELLSLSRVGAKGEGGPPTTDGGGDGPGDADGGGEAVVAVRLASDGAGADGGARLFSARSGKGQRRQGGGDAYPAELGVQARYPGKGYVDLARSGASSRGRGSGGGASASRRGTPPPPFSRRSSGSRSLPSDEGADGGGDPAVAAVDGELLLFSGRSPVTRGATLGFCWGSSGQRRHLVLLSRVSLDDPADKARARAGAGRA